MENEIKMKFYRIMSLVMAVMLIIVIAFSYLMTMEQDHRIQGLQSALRESKSEIEYRKNKEGKLIAEKAAAQQSYSDLKKNMETFANQISKDLDIKVKNMRAGLIASFQAKGEGVATITKIPYDSSANLLDSSFEPFAVTFDDGYLGTQVDIYSPIDARYTYVYSDTLTFAFHTKKKWLLGRKQLFSSGVLANPNAKITNSQAVLVKEYKDKRFGIGPYVGYGFGADGAQTTFGISVHYSLIRF